MGTERSEGSPAPKSPTATPTPDPSLLGRGGKSRSVNPLSPTLSPEGEREAFTRTFTALPADIDELGHVNNAVWVRWIQEISVAHWNAIATPEQAAAYVWVIVRHEIDYRGNLKAGETVTARTYVADAPQGAKWDRFVEFERDGRILVSAKTTWAVLDRAAQRLIRVPKEIVARFAGAGTAP